MKTREKSKSIKIIFSKVCMLLLCFCMCMSCLLFSSTHTASAQEQQIESMANDTTFMYCPTSSVTLGNKETTITLDDRSNRLITLENGKIQQTENFTWLLNLHITK